MAKAALTPRQRQIYDYITGCLRTRGYPPTLREIGEHMGIRSTNGVNDHLKALERKGYLQREELKSRALKPMNNSDTDTMEIPILGAVAAGAPIFATENVTDKVVVDRHFLGGLSSSEAFGLKVRGDSMIEDGIFDGDYLFVRKQPTAESGDIVVVMIEGEATCKRFYPEGETIRLQPANAAMKPIYVRKSEFRSVSLLGKVMGVYRRLH